MIAVIADDFTGAAEIGGIGLRYGLHVVIETETVQHTDADLLVIATDTRSLRPGEASDIINKITNQLSELNPACIYKKLDSVLRGNIAGELLAQMKASGKTRSIIIAANPAFKRIIRNGTYYVDTIPLNETSFSTDPEHPILSASVESIVGEGAMANLRPEGSLPKKGLIIGDVTNIADLEKWTGLIDETTLPAGGSGFFEALLVKHITHSAHSNMPPLAFGEKALFILGSTYPKEKGFLHKMGHYVSNMPGEVYFNKDVNNEYLEKWAEDIVHGICIHNKVVASIVHPPCNDPDIAFRVRDSMGKLAKKVLGKTELNELIVEGGSTTSVVLNYLGIKKLFPIQELEPGVIRMRIDGMPGLCLTTKPGSYSWPDKILFLYTKNTIT